MLINMIERSPDVEKFICLLADGSGCCMYRRVDNKLYEADGSFFGKDITQEDWLDMDYFAWITLPDDFKFFDER